LSLDPALYAELHRLVEAVCLENATPAELARLDELVCQNPAARAFYVDYLDIHVQLRWSSGSDQTAVDDSPVCHVRAVRGTRNASPVLGFLSRLATFGAESSVTAALAWLVMACVGAGLVLTVVFCSLLIFRGAGRHVDAPQVAGSGEERENVRQGERETRDFSSSHVLTFSRSSSLPVSQAAVARLIQVADCHWAIGSHSPHAGDDLEPGRKLVLISGLAEIMFESGVRALLQGPATLEIVSRTSAELLRGKLNVTVINPELRGFQVRAPGMTYTDLGTEFGVFVAKDGSQEMHVFRGKVAASREQGAGSKKSNSELPGPSALNSQLLTPNSFVLSASQAVRISAPGKPVQEIAADEKRFVRGTLAPVNFGLFSTGAGLAFGAADPHWEITDISTEKSFKPRAAVVAVPAGVYVRDAREKAQWISNSKARDDLPVGCRWTLRTHFDLTAFDAASARIEGRVSVDNFLVEIRLNGKTVPIPAGIRKEDLVDRWLPLKIEEGFASGDNWLEIVIENGASPGDDHSNPMGLCVDWKGVARQRLKLSAEE
jgi:hypothetical protein